jgi:hypothetical protein
LNGVVWTEVGEGQFDVEQVGAAALVEEFLDVVGFFEVAVSLVAVGMGGDEVVGVIEAEAIGEGLEGEALGGVERGHGVTVQRPGGGALDMPVAHICLARGGRLATACASSFWRMVNQLPCWCGAPPRGISRIVTNGSVGTP